jgi:ribosomal protein S18 acetylase RimI-like enzyme
MTGVLPEHLFANPIRSALDTTHGDFAIGDALARRYPPDVAPFATLGEPTNAAMERLRDLLAPGEGIWLFGNDFPRIRGLEITDRMPGLQMGLPDPVEPPEPAATLVELSAAQADEMVALTDLAFPGFFRRRTYRMGSYWGVRSPEGALIAMGGERMKLSGFAEVSAVCTHPDFRGRGHAESIIWQVVRKQRQDGVRSFLHVGTANVSAIALYGRLGFVRCREIVITRVERISRPRA